MKKTFLLFTFVFLFLGCSTKNAQTNLSSQSVNDSLSITHKDLVPSKVKLSKDKIIFIALVDDGKFKKKPYAGSGYYVGNYLQTRAKIYTSKIIMGKQNNFLTEARKNNADYALKTEINHWEPRTASSRRPTRVTISIGVYNVSNGDLILAKTFFARGKATSVVSQTPEGLAQLVIQEFYRQIY
jgi:ABC-type uncharacterized transport system auxiliary subunit